MQATEQFRLFLALSTPDQVKRAFEAAQTAIGLGFPDRAARWTRREQFHLTLRFLGSVPSSRIDELVAVTRAACRPFPPLRLTAAGIGFFPNARFPRVLWAGVKDMGDQLVALWTALQVATQPFTGEAAETEFTGHITLARLDRLRRSQAEVLTKSADNFENTVFGEWTVDHLDLMRSELLPQGARHSSLAELPLAYGHLVRQDPI